MKTVKIKASKKVTEWRILGYIPPLPILGCGKNEMKVLIGRKKMKNRVVKLSEIMEEN